MEAALGAMDDRPMSADRLPTLTEVVEIGREGGHPVDVHGVSADEPERMADGAAAGPAAGAERALAEPPAIDEERLVHRVLGELAPRIELLLESRLREALAPALARAADGLIRDARDELGAALRALVEQTVARALGRPPPR
jgi:hypothetical protein